MGFLADIDRESEGIGWPAGLDKDSPLPVCSSNHHFLRSLHNRAINLPTIRPAKKATIKERTVMLSPL